MSDLRERPFSFSITHRDRGSAARAGLLRTPHGDVPTPVFMPVGTAGTVKAVAFDQLAASGSRLILANTYHLFLRPGHSVVDDLGGLHRFQGWDGALLTDSAGFQVFSLADLARVGEDGVRFRSHLDGSPLYFTPELSMAVQGGLGADIAMAFDHCLPADAEPAAVAEAAARTGRWLHRCLAAFGPSGRRRVHGHEQVLFGILQGGTLLEERRRAAADLAGFDLPGYAIGGLSVGEPKPVLHELAAAAAALLPADRPRYLMGVGYPDDILAAVLGGVDMFDCVLPTRMARTGSVLTWDGRLAVKNREFARDDRPVDPDCPCPVCRRHSRAYLRHLFQAREILGAMLATQHNLWFYQELMRDIRAAIGEGRLVDYARAVGARWADGERKRLDEIARRDPRERA
ncbi:MAG TPA: tRNA guanosine(34) transglycosylase Tgt [Candidatus Krumholzibacteria bacterium]|nr:tRNA guanosine(34) transglycosylase Tgt [Candidatus Krumholzibacteria bacterium]HPD71374.1 tRNA guanosine(34) transglycosylase Tgt [Candidatus Krumholzibacteria bacterium]HRY38926.1 tRNA guanosine(34) transglycosylase Tgt [Candidatus Krumholzibacteria bacterium]